MEGAWLWTSERRRFSLLENELNVIRLTDIRASKICEMTCSLKEVAPGQTSSPWKFDENRPHPAPKGDAMKTLRWTTLPLLLGALLPLGSQEVRYRRDKIQETIPFSMEEALDLMGIGEATLQGQALFKFKKTRLQLVGVKKLYARDQVAYLFPMTKFLKAWVERYAPQGLFYGGFSLQPELDHVAARTITDAEGRFTFRGLKPGQYLLWVVIPYEMERTIAQETGQWATRTYTANVGNFSFVSAAVREPVTRAATQVIQLENHIIHVVNVPEGQKLVDLGEVQGERAKAK